LCKGNENLLIFEVRFFKLFKTFVMKGKEKEVAKKATKGAKKGKKPMAPAKSKVKKMKGY
jgi:hypothetical protein